MSRLAGTHLLLLRLGFQIPVAIAMFACVWIAARTTKRRAIVVLVGLQPMVWISVVNGAHAMCTWHSARSSRSRCFSATACVGAAVVIGLAALVKIAALFAAPIIVVVLLCQRRTRDAVRFAATIGGLMALAAVVAPSSFTSAAHATARHHLAGIAVAARSSTARVISSSARLRIGAARRGGDHCRYRVARSGDV